MLLESWENTSKKTHGRIASQISVATYSPGARRRRTRATSMRGRRPSRRPSRRTAARPPTPRTVAASAAWRSASPPRPLSTPLVGRQGGVAAACSGWIPAVGVASRRGVLNASKGLAVWVCRVGSTIQWSRRSGGGEPGQGRVDGQRLSAGPESSWGSTPYRRPRVINQIQGARVCLAPDETSLET
jgi:hypothetical protein